MSTSQQDSHHSCTSQMRSCWEWDAFDTRRTCSVQPHWSQRLLCLFSRCVPVPWLSTKHQSSTMRLLYTSRNMSSSREGVTSAGIRNGAWKAICWEGARAWPCEDAPSSLSLLSSLLGWFQATASNWLLLYRSTKTPPLPIPRPVMLILSFVQVAKCLLTVLPFTLCTAASHPALSSLSWLWGQAQDQWCKEICDHAVTASSLPLSLQMERGRGGIMK